MNDLAPLKVAFYLNRLALTENPNPFAVDPLAIFRQFFDSWDLAEGREVLQEFCEAALSASYNWKSGSPGNLLHFSERVEKLIEAGFLLLHADNFLPQGAHAGPPEAISSEEPLMVQYPCSLNSEELKSPGKAIASFFEVADLRLWKQQLHEWLEASLSNYSVLDNIASTDLIAFIFNMEKLIDGCYYYLRLHSNN